MKGSVGGFFHSFVNYFKSNLMHRHKICRQFKSPGPKQVHTCLMQACICGKFMCSHTKHQTLWWTRHLSVTQETSSERAADPFLLFGSSPSHKCLWSCRNLKKKWKQWLGKPLNITHSVCERKLLRAHPWPLAYSLPSIYIKRLHCLKDLLKSKQIFSQPAKQVQHWEAEGIALNRPTSNLHSEVLCYHAVPGSQVSVNKFVGI